MYSGAKGIIKNYKNFTIKMYMCICEKIVVKVFIDFINTFGWILM